MEIEVVGQEGNEAASGALAQLTAAAAQLERTAAAIELRIAGGGLELGGDVAKMVGVAESEGRLAELEAKLQTAEKQIVELRAQAAGEASAATGRKTMSVAANHLLAKHGLDTLEQINGGALDAALTGLSLEQRIAVKSQLLRAGLLG